MRFHALALAGLLALPAAAAAQEPLPVPGQLPSSRWAITPFVGLRVPYSTGDAFLYTENRAFRIDEERGGGAMAGAEVEVRARGPLSVLGSLAYGSSGEHALTLVSESGDVLRYTAGTPEVWMGKVAVAYRLPEPRPDTRRFHPAAFVFAGPSVVRMDFPDLRDIDEPWADATTNWGINFGVHTAATLGTPRVALHLGLEDYLTFWDTGRIEERDAVLYGATLQEPAVVDLDYSSSNLVLIRAGLSFRF